MHTRLIALAVLSLVSCRPLWCQSGCGVARDLVVQALENLKAGSAPSDLEDGIQLLKQASLGCPSLGDAWYYRSLFEDKIHRTTPAATAMRQAKLLGSEAMESGLNPFSLAAPPTTQFAGAPVSEKWALVVGIGQFQSRRIQALQFAKKDAQDFDSFLENPKLGRFAPDHVKTLTDKKATLVEIKAQLNWIAGHAKPRDLVLVYIASHGTAREKDPVGNLNYVLTTDTDDSNDDRLYASSLPMIELSEIVRSRIQARQTVILLDTCHSEGGTKGLLRAATASQSMLDGIKAGFGRAVIASSQQNQLSYESEKLENGIFTHYLIEGLTKQDGKMPLPEVFQYLQEQVARQTKSEYHAEQVPVLVQSEGAASIIVGVPSNLSAFNSASPRPQLELAQAVVGFDLLHSPPQPVWKLQ